jgi:uncharacterized heparinase superfamily protein
MSSGPSLMLRLLRTTRYLKPVQVINRLSRRFRKTRIFIADIPRLKPARHSWETTVPLSASITNAETVRFLNESGPLTDWQNSDKTLLWLYNLHYFDDLNAEHSARRTIIHQQLIDNWIQNNPPATGVGWQPYPISLRIVNWVKWLLAGNEPLPGMLDSLFKQAHVLNQQLEYHLQGNHLLANAKALVFAGSCFEGELAATWAKKGLDLLQRQHKEQLLGDGAHFELSPMYHSIVLMDVLDIIQLGQCYPSGAVSQKLPELRNTAASMVNWLEGMLHPDGDIPFFNDAAFGVAPRPAEILSYVDKMDVTRTNVDGVSNHYDASGYVALREHGQAALLDVAAIGPDYIPGHAHADTLSFEWSLHGQRVLVNSGTSEYGVSEERLRQRGTAAHNTVVVNGENSSEVWSGFRVARRARPFDVQVERAPTSSTVKACHTGYQRLRPKVTHRRQWQVVAGAFIVTDELIGSFEQAVAYFHFHPEIVLHSDDRGIIFTLPGGQCGKVEVEGGDVSIEKSSWHPEFGLSLASQRLAIQIQGSNLRTSFSY